MNSNAIKQFDSYCPFINVQGGFSSCTIIWSYFIDVIEFCEQQAMIDFLNNTLHFAIALTKLINVYAYIHSEYKTSIKLNNIKV